MDGLNSNRFPMEEVIFLVEIMNYDPHRIICNKVVMFMNFGYEYS